MSKASAGSANSANTVKLLVQDFSYNIPSTSAIKARNTINASQERIEKTYVDGVFAVEFSLRTYIKPVLDGNVTAPEEYLLASLMGQDVVTKAANLMEIDFANGNVAENLPLTIWFHNPEVTQNNIRLDNAVINTATFELNTEGILEIIWTGFALSYVETNTLPSFTDRTVQECIIGKFATVEVDYKLQVYLLALKSGGVTISNEITQVSRRILGQTTTTTKFVTGNRKITGNLEFYLKTGANASGDLVDVLLADLSSSSYESNLNSLDIIFGKAGDLRMELVLPHLVYSAVDLNFDQIYTFNLNFTANESAGQYARLTYYV